MAPKLAVIFRHLLKGGNFPACCRLSDVVLVLKESLFLNVEHYRPISIALLLSKLHEKIVAGKLSNFFGE